MYFETQRLIAPGNLGLLAYATLFFCTLFSLNVLALKSKRRVQVWKKHGGGAGGSGVWPLNHPSRSIAAIILGYTGTTTGFK